MQHCKNSWHVVITILQCGMCGNDYALTALVHQLLQEEHESEIAVVLIVLRLHHWSLPFFLTIIYISHTYTGIPYTGRGEEKVCGCVWCGV
jgi:hypothetical protein